MTDPRPEAWEERRWGAERVLVGRRGGATMAFALGPPDSDGVGRRLTELLAPRRPGLAAVRWCRQVHGATVHRTGADPPRAMEVGVCDGLVTGEPDLGLVVWSADCVPVLLRLGSAVAAVHAGWRGCAADVIGAAVRALAAESGGSPAGLDAALGPAVCGACYEVGAEVIAALSELGVAPKRWRSDTRVDLRGFIAGRLEALGAAPENIETVGGCTVETRELASYRRDGATAGRQWSLVFLGR